MASHDSFDIARMHALKAYAKLEQEVCFVLRAVLDVDPSIVGIIFYHISNTRARYAIINSLLQQAYPATYAKAWPKIESWLRLRDTARNHIIHWGRDTRLIIQSSLGGDGHDKLAQPIVRQEEVGPLSNSAKRWSDKSGGEKVYSETDVQNETAQMHAVAMVVRRYHAAISYPGRATNSQLFQQVISQQTPEDFLARLDQIEPPSED